jgi:hypothetical protein
MARSLNSVSAEFSRGVIGYEAFMGLLAYWSHFARIGRAVNSLLITVIRAIDH